MDRLCVWTWLELLLNTGADGVDEQQQQAQASTSGAGTDRDAFRDAVSIELCFQALHSSCLLPFLDRQLGSASFNDMASRQAATRATTNACRHTYRFTETKRNDQVALAGTLMTHPLAVTCWQAFAACMVIA